MLTADDLKLICERVLAIAPRKWTEVRVQSARSALTRLANNEIAQSIDHENTTVSVRVLAGGEEPTRVGVAATNRLDDAGLADVVARAVDIAACQHDDPSLMAPLGPQVYSPINCYDPAAADCPPQRRSEPLVPILKQCRRDGLTCAGAFSTGAAAFAMANSAGLFASHRQSGADLSITVNRGEASGWAQKESWRLGDIDAAGLARTATDIAVRSADPKPAKPGRYTVVLPPAAVAELLQFLVWDGLMTKAVIEGRSFFSNRLGQKVFGENITITDDAWHPLLCGEPFDAEGWPRQRVTMIDRGVFAAMVHGRETAKLADAEPTGHGAPPPSEVGAYPGDVVLAPGQSSVDEMIRSVDRGLLVTHFHYTNMLRPTDLTVTGMTRDGLFLIEGGRMSRPLLNMRFTESLVGAFNRVREIGRELELQDGFAVPAMLIDDFNFSSETEF